MLLPLITLVLVALLVAYLANQGALSATLVLIAAVFAAVLALGLYEKLSPLMEGWRPDYARGTMFLGVFFLAFSVLRLAIDAIIPKNIVLPFWLDRVIGGVVGCLAAVFITGATITGIEMLPVPEAVFGETTIADMAAASAGPLHASRGLAAFPQAFAQCVLAAASDHALGGGGLAQSFSDIHPDFATELTGYRHPVQPGSRATLLPALLDVRGVYVASAAKAAALHLPAGDNRQFVIIRTAISKGTGDPNASEDIDGLFRITPEQIRLVFAQANGARDQAYPIGYLYQGSVFTPLSPAAGQIVDTYSLQSQAIYDWVFDLDENARPVFLEVKQLARAPLPQKLDAKPFDPLPLAEYPPAHRGGTLQVALPVDASGTSADLPVWIMRTAVSRREIISMVDTAGDTIRAKAADWGNAVPGKGVPYVNEFNRPINLAREISLTPKPDVEWADVLQVLLTAQLTKDGPANLNTVPEYFNTTIATTLNNSPELIKEMRTDLKGQTSADEFAPGSYLVVVARKTSTSFRVWAVDTKIDKDAQVKISLSDVSKYPPAFEVDVTRK